MMRIAQNSVIHGISGRNLPCGKEILYYYNSSMIPSHCIVNKKHPKGEARPRPTPTGIARDFSADGRGARPAPRRAARPRRFVVGGSWYVVLLPAGHSGTPGPRHSHCARPPAVLNQGYWQGA